VTQHQRDVGFALELDRYWQWSDLVWPNARPRRLVRGVEATDALVTDRPLLRRVNAWRTSIMRAPPMADLDRPGPGTPDKYMLKRFAGRELPREVIG
jgi:hypothetical protein